MLHTIEPQLIQALTAYLQGLGLDVPVNVEQPKEPSFGEFALPVAFQLARQLKKAPRVIAQQIVDGLPAIPGVAALEIAGNGYINVRLDRTAYAESLAAPAAAAASSGKVIVEHTNINPNKAAHIGHLRNAVLGDTFVRMQRSTGQRVEVQNYIDNTGVQVADVVVGFHYLEKKSPAEVEALTLQPRFDYLCWDLYARVSSYYNDHPEAKQWRADTLHSIEGGTAELARLGHIVADAIVACHLRTMARLGIGYDVLPRESEILHLQFWAHAFEQLKERKAIYFETEGKNSGCWVMPSSAFREHDAEDEGDSKVIVRSNGTVTYVGKDIAYQLWKFGLLGKDFFYEPLNGFPGVWVATSTPSTTDGVPSFGGGSTVYNVIDSRQSYLQDVVVAGLNALGYREQAENSIHFSYEMVALSPRTCVELGIELSEEDKKKSHVEVSGRKGLGVKADDLMDTLIDRALIEVTSRHAEAPEAERREVASQIAIGALRFFMLKFTRNTVIAFDLQEALSFEGETGPYVQYSAVRARSILRKAGDSAEPSAQALTNALQDEGLWQFLLTCSRAGQAVRRAVESGEPAHVSRFAFQLAQAFSGFYHDYSVIGEQDAERRQVLVWLTRYFAQQLEWTLQVLGIPVPRYM
ncbi:MAG: arginine--tRNA ligase [Acidobacteria bacterium]|nr:arginine--tRNA ligase [Acidobacteriota bacterium]